MIELVVAMVVTLIISGAVFQLVTAGKGAFRREPEVADRQQNIRMGMDLIAQDLYRAGYGLPKFAQAFTQGLDGQGPMGPGGANSDFLELIAAAQCGAERVCDSPGVNVVTWAPLSACYTFPVAVILACEDPKQPGCPNYGVYWAEKPGAGQNQSCPGKGGPGNGHVNLPPGKAPLINPPGGPGFNPEWMIVGNVVRYEIRLDAFQQPNLERSAYGGQDYPDGRSSWEIIARGVEDLQIQYENGTGWHDDPGLTTCGVNCTNPNQAVLDTVVRRVRVQLSARALAPNLVGASTSAVGDAIRGQLQTVIAPRAAVSTLGMFH